MKLRIWSGGETAIAADPATAAAIREMITAGHDSTRIAGAIAARTERERAGMPHRHFATAEGFHGAVLWSGWLSGNPDDAAPQPAYPFEDGDALVLGPEIFASPDRQVICWRGENYVPQPEPEELAALRSLVWDMLDTLPDTPEAVSPQTLAFAIRAGKLGVTGPDGRPLVPACLPDGGTPEDSGTTIVLPSVPGVTLTTLIGVTPDSGSPCDAAQWGASPTMSMLDGRCRCLVCSRCGHHTGNSHQGHYWGFCKVTRTVRDFHMCCPDPAFGCELEAAGTPDGNTAATAQTGAGAAAGDAL